jgi:hypothetical protein
MPDAYVPYLGCAIKKNRGASFGATRELSFLHEPSGHSFTFPQANGDIFAFNTDVNKRFQHGGASICRLLPRWAEVGHLSHISCGLLRGGDATHHSLL